MLRLVSPQRDFFDRLLPPEAQVLSPQLKAVDDLLDDEPGRRHSRPHRGFLPAGCLLSIACSSIGS